ncbi:MAG: ABC transporter ATP-binding protein, partial [Paracoccaceae bacterium]
MSKKPAVLVKDAVKRYGDFVALKKINLAIEDNEFFTLLGPSGCGKTTLLRMIAGFEDVSEGEIFLFGQEIDRLPPHKRPVNTVFQNYALFPHMNVRENVAFGLEMLGKPKSEALGRADEMLDLVQLTEF